MAFKDPGQTITQAQQAWAARPQGPPDCFWRFEHAFHFNTFSTPRKVLSEVYAPPEPGFARRINAMEVYSGAGGTGFAAQRSAGCEIESRWCANIFLDAVVTYAVNHPSAAVRSTFRFHQMFFGLVFA